MLGNPGAGEGALCNEASARAGLGEGALLPGWAEDPKRPPVFQDWEEAGLIQEDVENLQ